MSRAKAKHCWHDPPVEGCRKCALARDSAEYQRAIGVPVTAPASPAAPRPERSQAGGALHLGATVERPAYPAEGPGAELKAILRELGFKGLPGCDCDAKAGQMNLWGAAGCRARQGEITDWMRQAAARLGWAEWFKAAARAVVRGWALRLDPRDPAPALVEEAIRRAEAREAQASAPVTPTP